VYDALRDANRLYVDGERVESGNFYLYASQIINTLLVAVLGATFAWCMTC